MTIRNDDRIQRVQPKRVKIFRYCRINNRLKIYQINNNKVIIIEIIAHLGVML